MPPKKIAIFTNLASLLSLTHDVLAYPAADPRPRSQSPDYDGSDYEQSAGQVFQTRCGQGSKRDDRGKCVTLEEIPTMPIDYGNLFGTVDNILCGKGFKRDDRGECVRMEEAPIVTIDYSETFVTPTTSSNITSSNITSSTTTSSTTEPSGSPKSTVLDKLVVSFVVVLFFVR